MPGEHLGTVQSTPCTTFRRSWRAPIARRWPWRASWNTQRRPSSAPTPGAAWDGCGRSSRAWPAAPRSDRRGSSTAPSGRSSAPWTARWRGPSRRGWCSTRPAVLGQERGWPRPSRGKGPRPARAPGRLGLAKRALSGVEVVLGNTDGSCGSTLARARSGVRVPERAGCGGGGWVQIRALP